MLWLGLVLAACDRLPTEHRLPPPQSFSASPDVWSGAELTITSQDSPLNLFPSSCSMTIPRRASRG